MLNWWLSQWTPYVEQTRQMFPFESYGLALAFLIYGSAILGAMAYYYGQQLGAYHSRSLRSFPRLVVFGLIMVASWVFMTYFMLAYWPLLVLVFALVDLSGTIVRALMEKRRCSQHC